MSGERPAHVIRLDEVDDWLADSVVKVVTFHRTSVLAARQIVEHGIDVGRSRIGSYGQGFYTSTVSELEHGDGEVRTAVRLRHALVGHADEFSSYVDQLTARFNPLERRLTPLVASQIRRTLVEAGYDGIVVHDGGGDGIDYVIALDSVTVKVIGE